MPEDPKPKEDPKPVKLADPAAHSELARAMASQQEAPEVVSEGAASQPSPKVVSQEKEAPKPPASQEGPEVEEGETEQESEQEGDEEFLKGLDITKPEEVLKALLEHPTLGRALQSWSDRGVTAQVEAARARDRPIIEASEREKAQIKADDEHFASMTQEEVAEEISKNPEAATSYAKYQARQQRGADLEPDGVVAASTVYALTAQIAHNSHLLEESDLPADKKTELAGKNFTDQGQDGIFAWGQAIEGAIIEQKAEARAQVLKEESWEAYKEEKLADLDGERPPVVRGTRTKPLSPLLEGESATQMEEALAHGQDKK